MWLQILNSLLLILRQVPLTTHRIKKRLMNEGIFIIRGAHIQFLASIDTYKASITFRQLLVT